MVWHHTTIGMNSTAMFLTVVYCGVHIVPLREGERGRFGRRQQFRFDGPGQVDAVFF